MADQLSSALGRQIAFVNISPKVMRDTLLSLGLPAWQVEGLLEDYDHYRRNEATVLASGVPEATDQAPRSFREFARDYATVFS